MGEMGKMRDRDAMGGWVHHEMGTAMEVEYCNIAADFQHEFFIMLGLGQIKARAVGIDVGAITRPLCLDWSKPWNCIYVPILFHFLHRIC